MEFKSLSQRVLIKASQKLGFADLAVYLRVPEPVLEAWIAGKATTPTEAVLRAVDLLVEEPASFWRESRPPASNRSKQ